MKLTILRSPLSRTVTPHNLPTLPPSSSRGLCKKKTLNQPSPYLPTCQVQEERRTGDTNAYLPREKWPAYDPNLVAEAMFAAANILSSLKLIYMFTVNPYLGPLQISLGRMLMDILKFFGIFSLVLFSFACGLNHLYWYYSEVHARECATGTPEQKEVSCNRKYRSFAK